jgi:phage gp46-like protein
MALVYDLAGKQEDPLVEEVLAKLYTDTPVRPDLRKDNRRHWQWFGRTPRGNSSRVWLSYAQPITDDTPTEISGRAEAALADLIPTYATQIEVSAQRTGINEVELNVAITRPSGQEISLGLTVTGGMSA